MGSAFLLFFSHISLNFIFCFGSSSEFFFFFFNSILEIFEEERFERNLIAKCIIQYNSLYNTA